MVPQLLLLLTSLAFLATYFPHLEATICWRKPFCNCYEGAKPSIYCRYVRNVSDIVPLLRKYSPVYKIRLQGSFRTLPEAPFDGVSVNVLSLTAPLSPDVPNNTLHGVQDLRTLILNGTAYQRIPMAFVSQGNRHLLRSFVSVSGNLTGLDTQLQNFSSCKEISLARNQISEVSGEAFLGSTKVEKLDLSRNQLVRLDPATFCPMAFLEEINLSHNRLHTVDGCFNNLNPKRINLYGNNLASVDRLFHDGMWNLGYLNLGGNPGINVTFNFPLKSIMEVHLSDCGIIRLDPSLLRNLWNLHYLYLNNNSLSSLPEYFLEHTPFVTTLELSNNRLTTVEGLFDNIREWYNSLKLTLDGNELTSASLGRPRINIYSMDFSRNRISDTRVEDMRRLAAAVYLNMSRNEIEFLEEGCFEGFRSLQYLDLSHNPITSLNRTVRDLPKLYSFNAESCMLENLTEEDFGNSPRINHVVLKNNSLSSVHGAFRNMKYISFLDVSGNNLTTLTADSFPPFQKISIRVRVLHMADNPWSCDCRMAWFADWVRRNGSKLMDEPLCASPPHLLGLELKALNRTDFETWVEDCPESCNCLCKADGLRTYTEVQCIRKGLNEVPKVLPPNARSLDLRGNVIESFDGQVVIGLKELNELNLDNNRIKQLVQLVLPPKLLSLRLAHNNLQTVPMGDWIKNVSITLSGNPWTCICETLAFRNWLIQHNDSIVDLSEVRCGNQESFSLRNRPIVMLTRKDLCSYLSSILLTLGCCAVFLILCLTCICWRQSLAACLYSLGCGCLKRSQTHDYPYDAFLMYSEEDGDLALGEIAKGLESGRHSFLLCIPARDIPSPRTPENVRAYLNQCTKVIVLLTRNFIQDQECMRLLISAMSYSTDSTSRCIVFITLDLPPVGEMNSALRILLKSCTRLRWGQCFFWQKLAYQLPKKRSKDRGYGEDVEDEPLTQ